MVTLSPIGKLHCGPRRLVRAALPEPPLERARNRARGLLIVFWYRHDC